VQGAWGIQTRGVQQRRGALLAILGELAGAKIVGCCIGALRLGWCHLGVVYVEWLSSAELGGGLTDADTDRSIRRGVD
jgi:hypothetical protein